MSVRRSPEFHSHLDPQAAGAGGGGGGGERVTPSEMENEAGGEVMGSSGFRRVSPAALPLSHHLHNQHSHYLVFLLYLVKPSESLSIAERLIWANMHPACLFLKGKYLQEEH